MRHHGNQVCLLFDCEVDSDSVCFNQQINDTNLHFFGQINCISKINHI